MDGLTFSSDFTKGILSKIVSTLLKKKSGYKVTVHFNNVRVNIDNGQAKAHIDVDCEMEKEELIRILKNLGLN